MLPDLPPQMVAALADTPLVLVMLWMITGLRRDLAARDAAAPPAQPPRPDTAREELAAFKLEVARTYVPLSLIRDLDSRLTQQLGRLEEKLDEVSRAATAAAAISGQNLQGRSMGFAPRAAETDA
jgi:choline-glycine betaine transporter